MKICKIRLSYGENKITPAQLEILNKFSGNNKFTFKKLEDFKLNSYDSEYKKEDPAHNKAIQIKKFEEYNKNPLKIPNRYVPNGDNYELVVDLDEFILECSFVRFEFIELVKQINFEENQVKLIGGQFDLSKKLDEVINIQENLDKTLKTAKTLNEQVNVHIGGSLLMTINEVVVKENYCTEALQEDLENGWRIVAVCVQADGRRPDYILGRYKENF